MDAKTELNRRIDKLLDEAIRAPSFAEKSRLIQQAILAQLGGAVGDEPQVFPPQAKSSSV